MQIKPPLDTFLMHPACVGGLTPTAAVAAFFRPGGAIETPAAFDEFRIYIPMIRDGHACDVTRKAQEVHSCHVVRSINTVPRQRRGQTNGDIKEVPL